MRAQQSPPSANPPHPGNFRPCVRSSPGRDALAPTWQAYYDYPDYSNTWSYSTAQMQWMRQTSEDKWGPGGPLATPMASWVTMRSDDAGDDWSYDDDEDDADDAEEEPDEAESQAERRGTLISEAGSCQVESKRHSKQRQAANMRERRRMQSINNAFEGKILITL